MLRVGIKTGCSLVMRNLVATYDGKSLIFPAKSFPAKAGTEVVFPLSGYEVRVLMMSNAGAKTLKVGIRVFNPRTGELVANNGAGVIPIDRSDIQ